MRRVIEQIPERVFDAVVIGSGVGGLTCAARLARAGLDVLVLEQHYLPGGYCTSYRRHGYTLDATLDAICGLESDSQFRRILEHCGVTTRTRFLRLDPIRENIFGDFSVRIPRDMESYEEVLSRRYPQERRGLRTFFLSLRELLQGMLMVRVEDLWDGGRWERVFPRLARHRRSTFLELMQDSLVDEELMSVLSERCSYIGLPPSRVSALSMAAMLVSYFEGGAYRVQGGFQRLADALVNSIAEAGSCVVLRQRVVKILFQGGAACGVVLQDGREIRARRVISNGDARATLQHLVGPPHVPETLLHHLAEGRLSSSFVVIHLGLSRSFHDLPFASSVGFFPGGSVERSFRHDLPIATNPDFAAGVILPTLEDASLAPPGKSIVSIHYLCPGDLVKDWSDQKQRIGEAIVGRVEELIPGLRDAAELFSIATPKTMWRYTLNEGGAAYGWEQSPERFARLRAQREGIPPRLHLVGHWTDWGGGVVAATCSGYEEARRILTEEGEKKVSSA